MVIRRLCQQKRPPRDFDYASLANHIREYLRAHPDSCYCMNNMLSMGMRDARVKNLSEVLGKGYEVSEVQFGFQGQGRVHYGLEVRECPGRGR